MNHFKEIEWDLNEVQQASGKKTFHGPVKPFMEDTDRKIVLYSIMNVPRSS